MNYIWESGGKLTRYQIFGEFKTRKPSSIYLALRRLEDKFFIECLQGRRHIHNATYIALMTKEDYVSEIIRELKPDMIKVVDLLGKK